VRDSDRRAIVGSKKIFKDQNGIMNYASSLMVEADPIPEIFKEYSKKYLNDDIKSKLFDKNLKFEDIHRSSQSLWLH
jgi:hypothetical protein